MPPGPHPRTRAAACAALCATAATGASEKGMYGAQLRRMLIRTAAGTCPADLMEAKLLAARREQMPGMAPELKAAGPIRFTTFVRAEQVNGERIETYRVAFAKGKPAEWHIGGLHGGKFASAYSCAE